PGFDQFDERAAWFYEAFSISKAMLTDTPGVGQRFLAAYQDKTGQWLTGGKTYRLRVPANPPVKQFWSVTVYDEATRQMIVNDARNTDVSSRHPDLRRNTMARWTSTSARRRPGDSRTTGWRRCLGRAISSTFAFTRPPSRSSIRPGHSTMLKK